MNIYLASSANWIEENPAGNRLRWSYPAQSTDMNGNKLGLPGIITIQRAPMPVRVNPASYGHGHA